MKYIFVIVCMVPLLLLGASQEMSIDAQIAQIQKASPKERVKLMNRFKRRIAQMNQQERLEAIRQMKRKMHHANTQAKEHIQQMQTHEEMQMQHHQNMNQRRVLDQVMHKEDMQGGGSMPYNKSNSHNFMNR